MKKEIKKTINEVMQNFSNISTQVDVASKPIMLSEGKYIIPLSKMSLAFGEASSDLPFDGRIKKKNNLLFEYSEDLMPHGGGNIGALKSEPYALIYIDGDSVKFISIETKSPFNNVLSILKELVKKDKTK